VVAPITGWQPSFASRPWMVRLDPNAANGLTKVSAVDAFQVKSLSRRRMVTRIGEVGPSEIELVVEAVSVVIGRR
jgi:mRNA interferase MazF